MTPEIIAQIILFGIALAMDAFAMSVVSGLTYVDMNKKRGVFIAFFFGFMQAAMPLIGFWLVEGITVAVGSTGGVQAGHIMATVVTWVAFGLLVLIGGKMLFEGISSVRKPPEERESKPFSIKEVLFYGFATSIDALATGVAFHNQNAQGEAMSTTSTIWLHAAIIMGVTFILSLIGVFLGNRIEKLLKGRVGITSIIGGAILLALAVWIVLGHYLGI